MTLLLRHEDVAPITTMDVAIEAMSEVFRLEGEGQVGAPQRVDVPTGHGWLRLLPVAAPGLDAFGFKAMNLTPGVGVRYAICLYRLSTGELRGIVDARLVTAMRTAATTAVATRLLARADPAHTAIIGTGAEARTHLEAVQAVRPASKVSVFSRSADNRAAFVARMAPVVGVDLIDAPTLEVAVADADIVVLASKSAVPVLSGRHLRPGMHVASIGSARKDQFELATDTFGQFARVVCDSAAHVFSEAGDAIAAVAEGRFAVDRAANLADLVVGATPGRTDDEQITLFKSVGTATQDIALASRLLDLAAAAGVGQDLGVFPDPKTFA